ncbi:hypothetical protein R1sor_006745 [Riccia sorocarpa]|uniref:Uncharacterized protein n=1 Tax=Riccia sorocarpa TaxID=122646 RepID=A0ABD3HUQ5_9MARC
MKRILVVLVALSFYCASSCNFLGAEGRPFLPGRTRAIDLKELADWLGREAKHAVVGVEDFGVGEDQVDEIVLKADKRKRISALPKVVQKPTENYLDEIDRLKLGINKILCESVEDGCDHVDDMEGSAP